MLKYSFAVEMLPLHNERRLEPKRTDICVLLGPCFYCSTKVHNQELIQENEMRKTTGSFSRKWTPIKVKPEPERPWNTSRG